MSLDDENQELFDASVQPEAPASTEPAQGAPQVSPSPPTGAPGAEPQDAPIPSWRLREEAEARRLAEGRAAQVEQRLNELQRQLQQAAGGKQQGVDFFEDPERRTAEIAHQIALRMVQPMAVQFRDTLLHVAREAAESRYGEKEVEAAEAAFLQAYQNRTLDPADYERIVGARNRYSAAVQWHKRYSTLSAVGDDPDAWFQKQLEARLSNPEFQQELLERVRTGAASRPSTTELPPSLSKVPGSGGNRGNASAGDLSHDSLFAFAMNK